MDDIIPQTFNDKINILFTHINNLYKAFANLTANYFVVNDTNNTVSVTADTFTINTTEKRINLGSETNPDVCLMHTGTENSSIPDGSVFFSNSGYGNMYLKISDKWTQICTLDNFRLAANGSVSLTNIGSSIFGESGKIPLAIDQVYEIEYNLFFKKTTIGSVTLVIKYDYQPSHHIISCNAGNETASSADTITLGATTIYNGFLYDPQYSSISITTSTLSDESTYYLKIKIFLTNYSLDNTIDALIYNSGGSVTILKNSYWTSKKI